MAHITATAKQLVTGEKDKYLNQSDAIQEVFFEHKC